MFHQIMFFYVFSIEHPGDIFIYETSCYFVIYQQFLRLHFRTLQKTLECDVKSKI